MKPGTTSGLYFRALCMPGTRDSSVRDRHGGHGPVPDALSAQSSQHALSEKNLGETLAVLRLVGVVTMGGALAEV